MTTPAVEAHELYRFFHIGDDETAALRGVSLTVDRGEVVAITGPSGSGKSTLLACLAGLDDPDGGRVLVDGALISRQPEAERARARARSIGMLFQSNNLIAHLSVVENVRLARRLATASARQSRDLLEELGLGERVHASPSELSGGESARAGLAVALANDPVVLLADEPTGEVDRSTEVRVLSLLQRQAANGRAVVVVTHSQLVAAAADRVIELEDGLVVS